MKLRFTNYRAVLLCESVMVYSAMAASIVSHDRAVDLSKCSLEYIRQIVMESCIRPHRQVKRSMLLNDSGRPKDPEIDVATQNSERKVYLRNQRLPHIPHELLPVDSTLVIRRKQRHSRSKRNVDSHYDVYFHYCCNNMDICENMECL